MVYGCIPHPRSTPSGRLLRLPSWGFLRAVLLEAGSPDAIPRGVDGKDSRLLNLGCVFSWDLEEDSLSSLQ